MMIITQIEHGGPGAVQSIHLTCYPPCIVHDFLHRYTADPGPCKTSHERCGTGIGYCCNSGSGNINNICTALERCPSGAPPPPGEFTTLYCAWYFVVLYDSYNVHILIRFILLSPSSQVVAADQLWHRTTASPVSSQRRHPCLLDVVDTLWASIAVPRMGRSAVPGECEC